VVQRSTPDSTTDLVPSEFPKQLDIAQVYVYGLSFLSAGLLLFLSLVNLRHPLSDKLRLNCICQSVILLKKTAFLGVENSRFERE
jgi:hypothetical protein